MRGLDPIGANLSSSLPGLTRASIHFRKKMDCRVKPGNDRDRFYPNEKCSNGSNLSQKRIGRSFPADRAGRPMSADDCDVVPQGQELVPDRGQQLPVIASGEIGAADRPREQDIANDCQTLLRIEQGDASRRMPRTMQHLECQLPDLDLISVFQPSVKRHVRGVPDTESAGTFSDVLQQNQIILVGTLDRNFKPRLQVCGTTDVIDVAVGQPDLVDHDAGCGDGALDVGEVAPGVDDHGTLAGFAPE